jgi:hypothetical protein
MTTRARRSRVTWRHPLRPVERALMLETLDLDPRFTYTDHELQTAWRRRRAQVHADMSKDNMVATLNTAYVTLISQAEIPRPMEVRL